LANSTFFKLSPAAYHGQINDVDEIGNEEDEEDEADETIEKNSGCLVGIMHNWIELPLMAGGSHLRLIMASSSFSYSSFPISSINTNIPTLNIIFDH